MLFKTCIVFRFAQRTHGHHLVVHNQLVLKTIKHFLGMHTS